MEPHGFFVGNTLVAEWRPVEGSENYAVLVEQCHDNDICNQIVRKSTKDTHLTETSPFFTACTLYNFKVTAMAKTNRKILSDSVIIKKAQSECDQFLEVGLIVLLIIVALLILLCIGALIYYHKKRPIQRIMRVRSKVYSSLYSKDQYGRPVEVSKFVQHVNDLLQSDPNLMAEFTELEQISFDTIQRKSNISRNSAVNRRRNRYQDIVPYDSNRIKLKEPIKLSGEQEASDYINASAISSMGGKSIAYIAAQGPSQDTSLLFWEMIWQQNVRIIVMLANVVEEGFVKCCQYWPSTKENVSTFQDIKVQLYDTQSAPDYVVRKFEVTRPEMEEEHRNVTHIQYTSWPDRSAPEDPKALLQLLDVTRALSKQYNGQIDAPWLIHCSAGIGRTGTFIAVDQLTQLLDTPSTKCLDIFNLVYNLRRERRHMVQTPVQYAHVYRCLRECIRQKEGEDRATSLNEV